MTKNKNLSQKMIEQITITSMVMTIFFTVIYDVYHISLALTLAITFGTTCYHLGMRLMVGWMTSRLLPEKINDGNLWFREKRFETALYRKLKVKQWKKRMPTYHPDDFSLAFHSVDEIIQTTCISEVSHEINIIFSFVPLTFSLLFDSFMVFLITSVLAAFFDFCFVMMQRYNRPRLRKILKMQQNQKKKLKKFGFP